MFTNCLDPLEKWRRVFIPLVDKQEIKILTTAQIRGQEYSKLGRVKEDKMKNCRRMSQAIWMKY